MNEFIKSQADIETSLADADRFQHSGVPELLENDRHVELHRALVAVGLDAPDEPRVAVAHRCLELKYEISLG